MTPASSTCRVACVFFGVSRCFTGPLLGKGVEDQQALRNRVP